VRHLEKVLKVGALLRGSVVASGCKWVRCLEELLFKVGAFLRGSDVASGCKRSVAKRKCCRKWVRC